MVCRLCGQRRARRACPALGHEICAVCCGTKRLVEIQCTSDCAYLASAREHPSALVVRQQQRDLELAMTVIRDFNQVQSQIFLLITTFIVRYRPPELHALADQPPFDGDVAEAAAALAATFETATRGVIYEHPAASPAGARLAAALKPVLTEAGQHGGTPFQRDAAVVLRRLEDAARRGNGADRDNPRAFVDLLGRVIRTTTETAPGQPEGPGSPGSQGSPGRKDGPSRLIVP